jgi:Dolichyl-phosphate-mannose-protein mannosyltransferase
LLGSVTTTYWAILGYAAIIAILAFGIGRWPVSAPLGGGSTAAMRSTLRRAVPVFFLLASGAVLLFGRRVVLRFDRIFNPDEALFSAAAMLTRHGWLNWNIADTTSSGPLNAAFLAWPYLFGGDITLFSTRLFGLFCIFGSLAFIFLALRRLSDDCAAIVAAAPAFIFLSASTRPDFVHYSSEQLSICLLAVALYLFVRSVEDDRLRYPLGAALLLGCVPFAKLQAAPIAAAIGVFVVARVLAHAWKGSPRSAILRAAAVCGAALPSALILLVPLAVSREFDAFLNGYLVERWYLAVHPWKYSLPTIISFVPFFRADLIGYGAMLAAALASLVFFARRTELVSTLTPGIVWTSALAVVLAPVSVIVIIAPGNAYFHYLLLAVPAIVIAAGVAFAAPAVLVRRRPLPEGLAFAIMLAIVLPAAHREQDNAVERARSDAFLHGRLFTAAHNLEWLRPRNNDRMVCWAWAPQCYVDAAIPPGTRDLTNEYQVYETPLRPYFRARFLEDFARSRPDFIIDFSAPGNFAYGRPEFDQDIAHFPEFARIIHENFELVSRVDPPAQCPRLYVRNARLAELNRSIIQFASIVASASMPARPVMALDDGSIFETCPDNWLLPPGALGLVIIRLHRVEPIRTVAILNTRDGADRVRLSIELAGKTVWVSELTLTAFPRWTWYRLDQPIAGDGLTIEILSARGTQAGLNEVKAYRD